MKKTSDIQQEEHIYSSGIISFLFFVFSLGVISLITLYIQKITEYRIFQHTLELIVAVFFFLLFLLISAQSIWYLFRTRPVLSITQSDVIIYPFLKNKIILKIDEIQSFSLGTAYIEIGPIRQIIIRMGYPYKTKKRIKKKGVINNEVHIVPILYFGVGHKKLVNLLSQRIKNIE